MKRAVGLLYTMISVSTMLACQPAPESATLVKPRAAASESVGTIDSVSSRSNPVTSSDPASAGTVDTASAESATVPMDEVMPFDPNPIPGEDAASLKANAASYPVCGTYYGTVFQCGNLLCAKSDPAYQNICSIGTASKPANGGKTPTASTAGTYPLCTRYYGTVYQCGSNLCAKSDSGYQNPCTIGPDSSPANGGTTPTQTSSSGYPVCPASGYYGSPFQCGNQTCAKSDSSYQNFCVITNTSRPAGSASSTTSGSSYPACPATYYGSLFQCGSRTCAKSDPNYQNICVVR